MSAVIQPMPVVGVVVEQRSPAWHALRAGRLTGSRIKDVMAKSKRDGKYLKARQDYMLELATERLTGLVSEEFWAKATEWGKLHEDYAKAAVEAKTGHFVTEGGFHIHPELPFVGASPDGLVGDDAGLELKCPFNSLNHVETLLGGMPEEHIPQVQCGLWVTGRTYWWYGSYDPRFPENLRLYITRVERDDTFIATMAEECQRFEDEVNAMVEKLRAVQNGD